MSISEPGVAGLVGQTSSGGPSIGVAESTLASTAAATPEVRRWYEGIVQPLVDQPEAHVYAVQLASVAASLCEPFCRGFPDRIDFTEQQREALGLAPEQTLPWHCFMAQAEAEAGALWALAYRLRVAWPSDALRQFQMFDHASHLSMVIRSLEEYRARHLCPDIPKAFALWQFQRQAPPLDLECIPINATGYLAAMRIFRREYDDFMKRQPEAEDPPPCEGGLPRSEVRGEVSSLGFGEDDVSPGDAFDSWERGNPCYCQITGCIAAAYGFLFCHECRRLLCAAHFARECIANHTAWTQHAPARVRLFRQLRDEYLRDRSIWPHLHDYPAAGELMTSINTRG